MSAPRSCRATGWPPCFQLREAGLRSCGAPDEVERVAPTTTDLQETHSWRALQEAAARLDALAVLRKRKQVQAEAPVLGRPGTYLEPFALRALALVDEDEALLERAIARFHELALDWHANETRRLKLQA